MVPSDFFSYIHQTDAAAVFSLANLDTKGFPTTDKSGKMLTSTQMKKLVSDHSDHVKLHGKYQDEVTKKGLGFIDALRKEEADLKQQVKDLSHQ